MGEVHTAIDAVDVKKLGVHRALFNGDKDMLEGLKENKFQDAQILDYLEGLS